MYHYESKSISKIEKDSVHSKLGLSMIPHSFGFQKKRFSVKIIFSSAIILKLNDHGCFSSTQCSFCKTLPTTHRCHFKISDRKHKLQGERKCGISFCAPHVSAWSSNLCYDRCKDHR